MQTLTVVLLCVASSWAHLVPINRNSTKASPGTRIIGGQAAAAGQFPWETALYLDKPEGQYFCGGALVATTWILTAGQCLYQATLATIQLGSNSLQATDANRLTLTSSDFIIHETFSLTPLLYDLGLIRLASPVATNGNTIVVLALAQYPTLYPGLAVTTTGWGQISDTADALSDQLNYVSVSIIDQHECEGVYGTDQVWPHMICARGSPNEGICFGDIGSPMVGPAPVGDFLTHVGIASFVSNNGCETPDPKGYVRTDAFYDWISQKMST